MVQVAKYLHYGQDFVMDYWPSDAWQLAHGETTMHMNEYLNSDAELTLSFYESDSPDLITRHGVGPIVSPCNPVDTMSWTLCLNKRHDFILLFNFSALNRE